MLLALVMVAAAAACGGNGDAPAPAPVPAELPEAAAPGARFVDAVTLADGTSIAYTTVLPDDFEPGSEHPLLLAFPPGGQQQREVDAGLDLYWASEARSRGWVVVSPVAPEDGLFFAEAAPVIPELVASFSALYPPAGGLVHVAGISNGGLSSFRAAIDNPQLFASVTTLPGFPPQQGDYEQLDRLAGALPVTMYVGELDDGWVEAARRTAATLEELGGDVSLTIAPGEGHIVRSLTPAELFDALDGAR